MKVALVTFGTRGDVQPFVALAQGLARAGHEVFLVAPANFAGLAETYGIPFRPMSCDTRELAARPEIRKVVESGSGLKLLRKRLLARRHPVLDPLNHDT